ncbi:hypothetical protein U2F10_02860 [Leptothoe sp. EHU-05/26/07-4]
MTTQREALKVIKAGGKIQNNILLDGDGRPQGRLTNGQLEKLLGKGLTRSVGYDQTETIQ